MGPTPTVLLVILLFASGPVLAGSGELEINQACAVSTGCFGGDAALFPVLISAPGSYRLTGNLTVPDANTNAIEISADDVTLDLNGFSILGPTVCTRTTSTTCSGTGSGIGIDGSGERTVVRNGALRGMGDRGVVLVTQDARVEKLMVSHCGGTGVAVSGLVTRVVAVLNGGTGISAATGVVSHSLADRNGGSGISLGFVGAAIENQSILNDLHGILAGQGSLVRGNLSASNTGFGLSLNASAYLQNIVLNNTASAGNDQLGANQCNGNTTCP